MSQILTILAIVLLAWVVFFVGSVVLVAPIIILDVIKDNVSRWVRGESEEG